MWLGSWVHHVTCQRSSRTSCGCHVLHCWGCCTADQKHGFDKPDNSTIAVKGHTNQNIPVLLLRKVITCSVRVWLLMLMMCCFSSTTSPTFTYRENILVSVLVFVSLVNVSHPDGLRSSEGSTEGGAGLITWPAWGRSGYGGAVKDWNNLPYSWTYIQHARLLVVTGI